MNTTAENRLKTSALPILLFGTLIWLTFPIMQFMWVLWFDNASHNNGILIPFVSAYLVWEKRQELFNTEASSSWQGFLFLIIAILVYLFGFIGAERFTQEVSMVLLLIGVIWFNFGNRITRRIVFPLLFLFLMIPPPHIFYNNLSVKLQLLSTKISMAFLHLLNVTVYNEGNVIFLPTMQLEVAQACSGIRSLFSLLTLGVLFAYLVQKRFGARIFLALSSIPIAILFNGIRISGTCILAQYWPHITDEFNHFMSGWIVFVFAFLALLLLNKIINLFITHQPARG